MDHRDSIDALVTNTLTVYIDSSLAEPLSGITPVEIYPGSTVRDIISRFIYTNEDCQGLALFDDESNKLDWDATIESLGITPNAKLYLRYDKRKVLQSIHFNILGTILLIMAGVTFVASTFLFSATGGVIPFDFGIVIDAGSTHTEVFLYVWAGNKDNGTGRVLQTESCEYEAGIASGIDPSNIITCVNNVTSKIPYGLSAPRLYLGATGGMRLLNLTSPKDVELILMTLRYALTTTSTNVETIDIISGEDEAVFSWITTNFLAEALDQKQDTYGALDLGGASTQYAYAIKSLQNSTSSEGQVLNLYGQQYQVEAKSHLCYGYFEAMDRSEAILMKKNINPSIEDPCLPKGIFREFEADLFFKKPCVHNKILNSWRENSSTIVHLNVTGSSKYDECKQSVANILNDTLCKKYGYDDCFLNSNLSSLNIKFMAFSGFYYVAEFFNATSSLENFINATQIWCNLSWEEIKGRVSESQYEHVVRYCFAAVYMTELLITKYGFDSSTWENVKFSKQVNNTDVGWSLGFMINATNSIPQQIPSSPVISFGVFVPLVVISFVMIIGAILLFSNNISQCSNTHQRLINA